MSAPKIELTQDHLKKMGFSDPAGWYPALKAACDKYNINTGLRLSAFFSNCWHESGGFKHFEENLHYSASRLVQVFPKYFNSSSASAYANNPQKIASKIYGGRMGNGPESTGEGYKYRGRGVIQLTGKSNYADYSRSCGTNCVSNPDLLAAKEHACMSAAWFFSSRGVAAYADADDIKGCRRKINGGAIGLSQVQALYEKCKVIFGVKPGDASPLSLSRSSTPGASKSSFSEPTPGTSPQYPYNLVFESRSGHLIEIDDTPGGERLHWMHKSGSYREMNEKGTIIDKAMTDYYCFATQDKYDYTGGDFTASYSGQSFWSVGGDIVFKSGGTLYLDGQRVQINAGILGVSEELNVPKANIQTLTVEMGYGIYEHAKTADVIAGDMGRKLNMLLNKTPSISIPPLPTGPDLEGGSPAGTGDGGMAPSIGSPTPSVSDSDPSAAPPVAGTDAANGVTPATPNPTDPSVHLDMDNAKLSFGSYDDTLPKAVSLSADGISAGQPVQFSQVPLVASAPDPVKYINSICLIQGTSGIALCYSDGNHWLKVKDDTPIS